MYFLFDDTFQNIQIILLCTIRNAWLFNIEIDFWLHILNSYNTLDIIKVENVKLFSIILEITKRLLNGNVNKTLVFSQINLERNNHRDSKFSLNI